MAPIRQSMTGLVHGLSKTGKSLMAASLVKPQLYLDVEMGSQFLPLRAVRWDPDTPPPKPAETWDTAVVRVKDWSQARRALDRLLTGAHPFRSVAVDSLGALQNRLINKVAGRNAVEIQDWGEILRELLDFTEQLRDLTDHPKHPLLEVLCTCPTKLDKESGMWMPGLRGQMATTVPYLFDITGYLFVEDSYDKASNRTVQLRFLRTRRTDKIEAGERVGGAIDPIYRLPMITGSPAQVMERNKTFQLLRGKVYAQLTQGIAKPVASENKPPPPAPPAPTETASAVDAAPSDRKAG